MRKHHRAITPAILCFFGACQFVLSVTPADAGAGKAMDMVRYERFGAVGDGVTDDMEAIARAHEFANEHGLPVQADEGATYYIGGRNKTAVIRTDTDWGTARFIIDDTAVSNYRANIFVVRSSLKSFTPKGVSALKKNQSWIDVSLPGTCLISVTDSDVKRYIRYGLNRNKGSAQTDVFIADKDGRVDMRAPIIWNFDRCTFSRFDAHQGVANATIRHSTLGHAGINAIGFGTFTVEDSTVYGRSFINLRPDYGSTWHGDFIIRNCVFVPSCGRPASGCLFSGSHSGQHDFGYTCYMPERITIDTLRIDDTNHGRNYGGRPFFPISTRSSKTTLTKRNFRTSRPGRSS